MSKEANQSARDQEVEKAYKHNWLVEKIGRNMGLSDLSDLVMSRTAFKAYNMKFADVEDEHHYKNLLSAAIRNEFRDLCKSKIEQGIRNGVRLDATPSDESGHGGFDLPASRASDPAVQAQGKERLRRVLNELSDVARHSKTSRNAVRIFLALFFDKVSVEDLARVEQIDDNYIHVIVCRLRKHLRKALPDLAE